MAGSSMSDYERTAYQKLIAPPSDSRSLVPRQVRDAATRIGRSVRSGASRVPGNEVVAAAYAKAARGLIDFTTGNGIHSVSLDESIRRHQAKGHELKNSQDFLRFDLRDCDEMLPNRKRVHEFVAIAEGAAASLLITGATVSTTVSGGTTAAVALATVAADSVFVMAGLGRVVGVVAVSYGFDPNLPEEELFALQVLGLGMAVGEGAKAAALASLSRLTQDMMRRATWTQLNEHLLVDVINRAFATMGLRLTQKKLAQVVPVAGVAISAGVNLQLLHRVDDAAIHAYRLRFLTLKYNLDPPTSTALVSYGVGPLDDEGGLQIDEVLDEAVREAESDAGDSDHPDSPKREGDQHDAA